MESKPEVRLIVEAGANPGRTFVLEDGQVFQIGRDRTCDYSLPRLSNVSSVHCRIENRGGAVSVTDLDSKNGTFVNGAKIKSRALRDNDVIEVGRNRLRLHFGSDEPEKAMPTETQPIIAALKLAAPPTVVRSLAPLGIETAAIPPKALEWVGKGIDSYKIMGAVAASGRGVVYKAIEPTKNRLVAIKLLSDALLSNVEGMRWFVEGAKVAGKLRHDDLVPVLGGGRVGKKYYYVTLFMARGSALTRFRRAPKEGIELVKFALQTTIHMTRALEFGSQQKISHRGLRPTKILFDEEQQPKLNGLGFDNGPGPGFDMKSVAATFVAPEQIREPAKAGVTADIYGLGGCFYYMLTSTVPQREPSGQLRAPKLINRVVPESLCRIVEKMLEQDPAKRYDNYGLLLHDLRWALRGEIWPRG